MNENLKALGKFALSMFRPPKRQTVSEWADENRMLVSESSAEPGRWRTDRAPYQKEVMNAFNQRGVWQIVIKSSSQVGKALDINTEIPTPDGWKTMEELKAGDRVFDENGEICLVTAVTDVMYGRKCYKMTFSDGNAQVADGEHKWQVDCFDKRGKKQGKAIKTTAEISEKYTENGKNLYAIPVSRALELPQRKLDIPPYTLGAWLGDGNSLSAQITQSVGDTEEIIKNIEKEGVLTETKAHNGNANTILLNSKRAIIKDGICIHGHDTIKTGLTKKGKCAECARQYAKKLQYGFEPDSVIKNTMHALLKEKNLIGDKHIPQEYLRASKEQRFSLLQGLMDTDGSIGENGRCEISLKSTKLAFGVSELLHSLGIKHKIKQRTAAFTYKGEKKYSDVWRLSFLAYKDTPVFSLDRKAKRQKERSGKTRASETESRRIICVEEIETRPVKCISVSSESHLYLAGRAMISTHNSEMELNMLGFAIDVDPGPILYIQPTDNVAEDYSKRRIAPMIKGCPNLNEKVYKAKGRDASNTINMKMFYGGSLAIIGSNSPSDLSSKPVRYIFMDETDRFADSAGTEGDPQELAERRTETFRHNRKIVKTSTPTIKGKSRIERDYMSGTQEEWRTRCPDCLEYNYIVFQDIKFEREEFENSKGEIDYYIKKVVWKCPNCGAEHGEFETKRFPAKWVANNPKALKNGIRSFSMNAFMSPWSSWKEICIKFLKARKDPEKLKVFYNTMLGESFEFQEETGLPEKLYRQREHYSAEVPREVLVLTMGIDTQDNRLEYEVVGWDRDEQSWGIAKGVIPGRADAPGVWEEVDALLDKEWQHASGMKMRILASFIDSGGHFTQDIYKQCDLRTTRRLWAIKGEGGEGKPYCRPMKRQKGGGSIRFIIGTDTGKEAIMYAAALNEVGTRYMHYPMDERAGYDMEYFKGLISERMRIHRKGGKSVLAWEKFYERNEPLDCRNYARAAYRYFNWHFDELEKMLHGEKKKEYLTEEAVKAKKRNMIVSRGIKI